MVLTTRVESEIRIALLQLAEEGLVPGETAATSVFMVERPKKAEHGHFATNVALTLSKIAKKDPRSLAELIRQKLALSRMIASAEMAGPGFLNLRLKPEAFHECLLSIAEDPKNYGRKPAGSGDRIHLEFVSANPTGPINVASGRNAILGDSIGRVLEAAGHRVTREYYINDFGNQLKMFYESVKAVAEDRPLPEDGYHGEYVREIAAYLKETQPALISGDPVELGRVCVTLMLRGIPGSKTLPGIKRSLRDVGVEHDVWFSEESLHRWGAVREVLASLEAGGWLVRKEGALFFVNKATEEKDQDKDRVVQKTDGSTTYFASDIAYHEDKINRGYDHLIAILGADHHGYVARIRNALEALGYDKNKYEAILYQLVFIYRNGELVRMGKRAGNFVTIEEVAEEVDARSGRKGAGRDAMRFFFLSRSPNVQVDFDLDLATKKSLDNPVFYVQYAHARLSSILKKADEIGFAKTTTERLGRDPMATLQELVHEDELSLLMRISEFPSVVAGAAEAREPHRLTYYSQELAREFQSYFTRMRNDPVLPQESVRSDAEWRTKWNMKKTHARLVWIDAVRSVLQSALGILGVSAPERMDLPEESDKGGAS